MFFFYVRERERERGRDREGGCAVWKNWCIIYCLFHLLSLFTFSLSETSYTNTEEKINNNKKKKPLLPSPPLSLPFSSQIFLQSFGLKCGAILLNEDYWILQAVIGFEVLQSSVFSPFTIQKPEGFSMRWWVLWQWESDGVNSCRPCSFDLLELEIN